MSPTSVSWVHSCLVETLIGMISRCEILNNCVIIHMAMS